MSSPITSIIKSLTYSSNYFYDKQMPNFLSYWYSKAVAEDQSHHEKWLIKIISISLLIHMKGIKILSTNILTHMKSFLQKNTIWHEIGLICYSVKWVTNQFRSVHSNLTKCIAEKMKLKNNLLYISPSGILEVFLRKYQILYSLK